MPGQEQLRLPPLSKPSQAPASLVSPVAMLLLSLLAGCCVSAVAALPVAEDGAPAPAPAVTVKNGTYAGVHAPGYGQDFFLGMPYAQKAERWTQAQGLNGTWPGSRPATAYPKHCVGYGGDMIGYEVSEDCLYLNVVRPAGLSETDGLPVAVWIHGGGLFMGGSADKRYNLSFIVEESVKQGTPMIGVSLNYRLSAFGFPQGKQAMDAGIANLGFLDQRLALRWINENIAAFGGSPDKVTIWGESSGAESVSAQVFAYNGRDDGLFRGAIAQSGFGGVIPTRFPGGFNNTAAPQAVFDALVTNTTCAPTVGTDAAVACVRGLPFEEINAVLNGTAPPGPWAPQFDGDFFADYTANQVARARFPRIPVLIGHNTDEGTSFGQPGIQTDADLAAAIRRSMLSPGAVAATGKSEQALVDELMYLYPDVQSRGIPSLAAWPEVIAPGSPEAARLGLQYRRSNALFGDLAMAYCRRRASRAWAAAGLPSWSYRFDAGVVGVPPAVSSAHFFEVAYVFANLAGVGYAPDARPFPPAAPGVDAYTRLARAMSAAWVNFITGLDPNGAAPAAAAAAAPLPAWPAYNLTAGGGVGQNLVFAAEGDGSYVEIDDYRAEGINWMIENSLNVLGN